MSIKNGILAAVMVAIIGQNAAAKIVLTEDAVKFLNEKGEPQREISLKTEEKIFQERPRAELDLKYAAVSEDNSYAGIIQSVLRQDEKGIIQTIKRKIALYNDKGKVLWERDLPYRVLMRGYPIKPAVEITPEGDVWAILNKFPESKDLALLVFDIKGKEIISAAKPPQMLDVVAPEYYPFELKGKILDEKTKNSINNAYLFVTVGFQTDNAYINLAAEGVFNVREGDYSVKELILSQNAAELLNKGQELKMGGGLITVLAEDYYTQIGVSASAKQQDIYCKKGTYPPYAYSFKDLITFPGPGRGGLLNSLIATEEQKWGVYRIFYNNRVNYMEGRVRTERGEGADEAIKAWDDYRKSVLPADRDTFLRKLSVPKMSTVTVNDVQNNEAAIADKTLEDILDERSIELERRLDANAWSIRKQKLVPLMSKNQEYAILHRKDKFDDKGFAVYEFYEADGELLWEKSFPITHYTGGRQYLPQLVSGQGKIIFNKTMVWDPVDGGINDERMREEVKKDPTINYGWTLVVDKDGKELYLDKVPTMYYKGEYKISKNEKWLLYGCPPGDARVGNLHTKESYEIKQEEYPFGYAWKGITDGGEVLFETYIGRDTEKGVSLYRKWLYNPRTKSVREIKSGPRGL